MMIKFGKKFMMHNIYFEGVQRDIHSFKDIEIHRKVLIFGKKKLRPDGKWERLENPEYYDSEEFAEKLKKITPSHIRLEKIEEYHNHTDNFHTFRCMVYHENGARCPFYADHPVNALNDKTLGFLNSVMGYLTID